MTTMTMDAGLAAGKLDTYLELYRFGKTAILKNLESTPDDKVSWQPAAGARSALEIAAHVAGANQYFIEAFKGNPPATDFPEIMKWIDKTSAQWTTRDRVVAELNRTHEELDQIFARLTPDILENDGAKLGLYVISFHALMHTSQIDYLQTCWGDRGFHYTGN